MRIIKRDNSGLESAPIGKTTTVNLSPTQKETDVLHIFEESQDACNTSGLECGGRAIMYVQLPVEAYKDASS